MSTILKDALIVIVIMTNIFKITFFITENAAILQKFQWQ